MKQNADMKLQRYELKYQISPALIEPIANFVACYGEMDYHSKISPGGFYTINSLYFDSPNFQFLKNKQNNLPARFNMRIRSYGDHPKMPIFFELKYRFLDMIQKKRAKVTAEDWPLLLTEAATEWDSRVDSGSLKNFKEFLHLYETYHAEPKVLTQYRRQAWFSTIDDYARITFDKDLRFQRESGFNVRPDESYMNPYDFEDIYHHPEENVVLEVKCLQKVPRWILDLIQTFNLKRSAFSKYENGIRELVMTDWAYPTNEEWLTPY